MWIDLKNDVIWTNKQDENERLREGTYMVFSKIEHDLERWRQLGIREQERWVGRSKGTITPEELYQKKPTIN